MATVFKRGGRGNYLIQYFDVNGKRQQRSSRTTDKRAAERIAASIEAETALRREGVIDVRSEQLADQARVPLAKHVEDYIQSKRDAGRGSRTITDLERLLGWLIETTKASRLDDLSTDAIATALRSLSAKGLSARTYNHHLSVTGSFLRWCVKMGRITQNPAQILSPLDEQRDRRRVRRSLTPEEVERLLAVAEKRGRKAWYLTALWAGLRLSELGRLKWGDVDLEQGTITIRDGKAHRVDRVPMHADLIAELGRIKPALAHPSHKVFATRVTNATRTKDFARARIELVNEEGHHADLHACRTTLGTMLAREGVAPQVAKKILRHSDYRTTLKSYTALDLADTRTAVEALSFKTTAETTAVAARNHAIGCETVRVAAQPLKMAAGAEWADNRLQPPSIAVWSQSQPRASRRRLEAAPGFEPGITDLQSVALPLGHAAVPP